MGTTRYRYHCHQCGSETETAVGVQQDGGTVTWCLACLFAQMQDAVAASPSQPSAKRQAPSAEERSDDAP